jgi:DNA-binding NarL/FixJ family response regulator
VQGDDVPKRPQTIHVLVADLPKVVSEVVARLVAEEPDMILVGESHGQVETLRAARDVDVLVLGTRRVAPMPGLCTHLLSEYPRLTIVAMSNNGESAIVYRLGLRRRSLRRVTVGTVLRSLRCALA